LNFPEASPKPEFPSNMTKTLRNLKKDLPQLVHHYLKQVDPKAKSNSPSFNPEDIYILKIYRKLSKVSTKAQNYNILTLLDTERKIDDHVSVGDPEMQGREKKQELELKLQVVKGVAEREEARKGSKKQYYQELG
jgi:DNA-binding NtrC family response regulator